MEDRTAALRLDPTAGTFRDRARFYRAVDNSAAALGDMDKAIRLDPTADDHAWKGWTDLKASQGAKAVHGPRSGRGEDRGNRGRSLRR
jgi:hypothetical protein